MYLLSLFFILFLNTRIWDSEAPAAPIQTLFSLTQLYPQDTASPLSHQAELSRTAVWHSRSTLPGKVLCLHTPVPAPCQLGSQRLETKKQNLNEIRGCREKSLQDQESECLAFSSSSSNYLVQP